MWRSGPVGVPWTCGLGSGVGLLPGLSSIALYSNVVSRGLFDPVAGGDRPSSGARVQAAACSVRYNMPNTPRRWAASWQPGPTRNSKCPPKIYRYLVDPAAAKRYKGAYLFWAMGIMVKNDWAWL